MHPWTIRLQTHFFTNYLNIGDITIINGPAMDGIGELEALPQEEMVEVLEVIGYEKRTIGE